MSGPYCETCRYFREIAIGVPECDDPSKIIYDRNGNRVETAPSTHEKYSCSNHRPRAQETAVAHEEYLRRNLIHASAVGSKAAFEATLKRLASTRRPPKWLVEMLRGGLERAEKVHPEVAKWRNAAPDAPVYAKPL